MLGSAVRTRKRTKSEGEKPFWISYADLMTAIMVLFLTAMAVTIAAVTQKVASAEDNRKHDILEVCTSIRSQMASVGHVVIDCQDNRISFGEAGRFATNNYKLPNEANEALAKLLPVVLEAADSRLGRKWMKQVVVEGSTDTVGSYLYNLHLSLERSEWVMCLLTDPKKNTDLHLSPEQLGRVRQLFLAGGVSFNNQRATADESRRVEMRMDFLRLGEAASPLPPATVAPADTCQL